MTFGSVCGSIPLLVMIGQLKGFEMRLKPSGLRGGVSWESEKRVWNTRERIRRALSIKKLGHYVGVLKD